MAKQHKPGKRQKQILEFIRTTMADRGFPPSIREIGEAVDLSSSSTVHSHLRALEQKGFIRRSPGKPRSIELVQTGPSRVQVLEGLLRRGVELAWPADVSGLHKWAAEAQAVLPEVA